MHPKWRLNIVVNTDACFTNWNWACFTKENDTVMHCIYLSYLTERNITRAGLNTIFWVLKLHKCSIQIIQSLGGWGAWHILFSNKGGHLCLSVCNFMISRTIHPKGVQCWIWWIWTCDAYRIGKLKLQNSTNRKRCASHRQGLYDLRTHTALMMMNLSKIRN